MPSTQIQVSEMPTEHSKIIVVEGNQMLPHYRHGDQLIVSDKVPMKIGDRVILETCKEQMFGGTLAFRGDEYIMISLKFPTEKLLSFAHHEIKTLGRVIWASQ